MNISVSFEKNKLQFKSFCGRFIFWFVCIPFNILPIFLKYWRDITPETFMGVQNLVTLIVGDIDFTFVNTSSVFVLCIESFFVSEDFAETYKKFRTIALFYEFCLLIFYVCFFLKPNMFELLGTKGTYYYNIVILVLTIILGVICNLTMSMKRGVIK